MEITKAMKSYYDNRTRDHIRWVNYFAKKLGKEFPNHDADKFNEDMYEPYVKYSWSFIKNIPLDDKEMEKINKATIKHLTSSKHHPEYWDKDRSKLKNYSRDNPECGIVAYNMDKESLMEMACDLCAMSKEHKNDPFNWWAENAVYRWVFTEEQKEFIFTTINKLWVGEGY